jgi:hypothetical protein
VKKEDINALRGRQVTVGELTFQMPKTDEEVIDRQELIAEIEEAMKPHKDMVDLGKACTDAIYEDVRELFRLRRREERTGERQETIPVSPADRSQRATEPPKGRGKKTS